MISVAGALAEVLPHLKPLPPAPRAVRAAIGHYPAAEVVAPRDCPAAAIALAHGFAVAALETAGAAIHAPIPVVERPVPVAPGDRLPRGCDAVLPAPGLVENDTDAHFCLAVAPGENARLPGQDLRQGARLATPGERITPQSALTLELADVDSLDILLPRVAIIGFCAPAEAWLRALVGRLGGIVGADTDPATIIRLKAGASLPRLALAPGESAMIALDEAGRVVIELPERFDGLVAASFALLIPTLAQLMNLDIRPMVYPLSRKVTSRIGMTEAVLLAREGRQNTLTGAEEGTGGEWRWRPLGAGEITLGALGRAAAIALIPPGSEGLPAGAHIEAFPLGAEGLLSYFGPKEPL